MKYAIDYLRKLEWSMGNGQCPECCGVHSGWYGHPLHSDPKSIGHKDSCALAAALIDLKEATLLRGEYEPEDGSSRALRPFIQDKYPKALQESMDEIAFAVLTGQYDPETT